MTLACPLDAANINAVPPTFRHRRQCAATNSCACTRLVLGVDIGAGVQEQLDQRSTAAQRREHQRRVAVLGGGVHLRARAQQQRRGVLLLRKHGSHERSAPVCASREA